MNQRWRGGRDSYRPPGETIRTREYDVQPINLDSPAKAFVLAHHYEHSYPAAVIRHGLYRRGRLVGVAVYSVGMNARGVTNAFPGLRAGHDGLELGRFVLLDEVPGNGETWFLGRSFHLLRREGIAGVVSYSDPMPRTTAAGQVAFGGHVGCIYQAHNAAYLGRCRKRTLRLYADGSVALERRLQKIRNREQGWEYSAQELVRHGAEPPAGDLRGWLAFWLPRLTRTARHPGNHKYAWGLHPRAVLAAPRLSPYPKKG
jgi:hypothetical protein